MAEIWKATKGGGKREKGNKVCGKQKCDRNWKMTFLSHRKLEDSCGKRKTDFENWGNRKDVFENPGDNFGTMVSVAVSRENDTYF